MPRWFRTRGFRGCPLVERRPGSASIRWTELTFLLVPLHRSGSRTDQVIQWLTGFDESALNGGHLAAGTTFEDFFADVSLNPSASLITGLVCGVRVENVEDPLM